MSIDEVAQEFGTYRGTLYRWAAAHPDTYGQALKLGKEISDSRVELSLYQRAIGYTQKSYKVLSGGGEDGRPQVVAYDEHVPADVAAARFWLVNRRGGDWCEKSSKDVTGANGGAIQVQGEINNLELARQIAFLMSRGLIEQDEPQPQAQIERSRPVIDLKPEDDKE